MNLELRTETEIQTTLVSNIFIDEHLAGANDAQIKVYLYLLRMLSARLATSLTEVADHFNFTEKEIGKALFYWQDLKVLDLQLNEDGEIIGITFKELRSNEEVALMDAPSEEKPVSNVVVREIPAKVSYSADQLKELAGREDISQLMFLAETYKGKVLTFADFNTLLYFKEELRFSDDLIDYLFEYCCSKSKNSFPYMEKVAKNWYEDGIETPDQAKLATEAYQKEIIAIMKSLGKNTLPAPKELEYIQKWTKAFLFPIDLIVEACNRTVLATDRNRFEYADGILTSWKDANVTSFDDIARLDQQNKTDKTKKNQQSGPSSGSGNAFNQFPQNQYDFEALEKEFSNQ